MTTEEYRQMEREALDSLQRLRALGINGNNIVFVMSRDVYLVASTETNAVCRAAEYSYDGTQAGVRSVYQGYDIFIINEETRPTFQPAIKGFRNERVNYNQLSLGDIILSETADEDPHIFIKMQDEPPVFNDNGLTVRQEREHIANGRVTFADRIRARQGREAPWRLMYDPDWITAPYTTPQPDFLSGFMNQPVMSELERQFNEIAATMQGTSGIKPKRKKVPPAKDWDERLTPDDTKELDEFLNSLAKNGTLESAT